MKSYVRYTMQLDFEFNEENATEQAILARWLKVMAKDAGKGIRAYTSEFGQWKINRGGYR